MHRFAWIVLLAVAACAEGGDRESAAIAADEGMVESPVESPVEPAQFVSGEQAYERVCAGCHEEGVNGAPRTGHPEDWAGRSRLWDAVLFEHAREGYGRMPARGGEETLPESLVTRAAEHMMALTFPDTYPN